MLPIILASSSPYRQQLLEKLGIPFTAHAPNIDESALPGESPIRLVQRLAIQKAQAIQTIQPSWVIGSDQVAVCKNHILTKSHGPERAFQQLAHMSGQKVRFVTGLCLLNTSNNIYQVNVEIFTVYLRKLSKAFIQNYIRAERPFDCAGSFKVEGRGMCMVQRFCGRDLNALVGLPLIRLIDMFYNQGISLDQYW
ncbi:MAG: Maf family protein [Gammaproteobacteria bacterium]